MIRMRTLRDSKYIFAGFQLLEPSTIRLLSHFTESLHLASFFPFGQSFGIYFGMCFPSSINLPTFYFQIHRRGHFRSGRLVSSTSGKELREQEVVRKKVVRHHHLRLPHQHTARRLGLFLSLAVYNKPIYQFGRVVFFIIVMEESDPSTVGLLFVGVLL